MGGALGVCVLLLLFSIGEGSPPAVALRHTRGYYLLLYVLTLVCM